MAKSKCKWCKDGIVLDRDCKRIIRRFVCDIDSYDPEIGCNPNCHGYQRPKESEVRK